MALNIAHLKELLMAYRVSILHHVTDGAAGHTVLPLVHFIVGHRALPETLLVEPLLHCLGAHLLRYHVLYVSPTSHVDIVIEYVEQRFAEFILQ